MSIFEQFGVDNKKEEEGVWIEYPCNSDGSIPSFKISRMSTSNKKYMLAMEKATRPIKRQLELNILKPEVGDKIFLQVFCDVILLDWKNIVTKKGDIVLYSKEEALSLMEKLPELYKDLRNKASEMANFIEEEMEDDSKN